MADNVLIAADLAPNFCRSNANWSPITVSFQVGMFCLAVGISAELDGLSLITGIVFIVCAFAAVIIEKLHLRRFTKAVEAARLKSSNQTVTADPTRRHCPTDTPPLMRDDRSRAPGSLTGRL